MFYFHTFNDMKNWERTNPVQISSNKFNENKCHLYCVFVSV